MNTISIEKEYVFDYIKDILAINKNSLTLIKDAKYHHNSAYSVASKICKYGILTFEELNQYGFRNDSSDIIKTMSDISSHANGIEHVSLAVTGLVDLYNNEEEYNPYKSDKVDFRISSELKTRRYSVNYGNEFLSYGSIPNNMIKSIDVRFVELIEKSSINDVVNIIDKYNCLIDIAASIESEGLDIPLRLLSYDGCDINKSKLAISPKILIKK